MRPIEELGISNTHSKPSEEEIKGVEILLGKQLPDQYINFIALANGGNPEINTFFVDDKQTWDIDTFFFIGKEDDSTESINWNYSNLWDSIPQNFLPIARDGGDNLFLLNLRKGYEGEVWIWIHDMPSNNFFKLSNSFEGFINSLKLNPDYR